MAQALMAPLPHTAPGLFDISTPPGGYTWWYADGLSRDGELGFTLIAFVGSVFSPYYAWSGRRDPYNHCAVNLALYGPRNARWTMTERGRGDLHADETRLAIGPSSLHWDGASLTIDINEHGMPLPLPVRGQIRIRPRALNHTVFQIDSGGAHTWRPIAPSADVLVDFSEPGLSWRGEAYVDTNRGDAPLEDAFRYWDWSRVQASDGRTAVLYNTVERSGTERSLALMFAADGSHQSVTPPPEVTLPPTSIFRIKRTTRAGSAAAVRLGRTLEDTPFYSRSVIESDIFGIPAAGVHESFDGDRLGMGLVKLMLPFRMPRRPIVK